LLIDNCAQRLRTHAQFILRQIMAPLGHTFNRVTFFFLVSTMIDLENETPLTFAQVTKIEPGRPNITTVWRWRNRGCRGIKLETVLSGGRRFTSVEALRRFHERVTAAADGEPIANGETPRQRKRAITRAEKRAQELGV
jgi:hypothetical protein